MRILIVTVTDSIKGGQIRKERIRESEHITLGRGTDQLLHVPDPRAALAHARLYPAGPDTWQLESLSPAGVLVNGRRLTNITLGPGDTIQIGASYFTLIKPPPDCDAALEVRHHPWPDTKSHPAIRKYVAVRVGRGFFGLTRRSLAWLLFIVVLSAGLVLPVASYYQPQVRENLHNLSLPDDHFWKTGTLFAGHQHISGDCNACHVRPFQRVDDPICLSCHTDTTPHARLPDMRHPVLAAEQCASCHREHNGQRIIPAQQRFCADCHADLTASMAITTDIPDASDFARHHPQFSTRLSRQQADGTWERVRVMVDDPGISERSYLTFPHDEHLNPAGLETLDGPRTLECGDCHQPDASGRYMQPIDFEQQCMDCHQLNFDPSEPERVVPHGKPDEVVNVLTEFYAELALRGASREVSIPLPDRNDPGATLLWARQQALRTGEVLFQGRACGECHQVERQEEDGRITWLVQPPRVAGIWFPRSSFDHTTHRAQSCDLCHNASTSASSSDVLLPGIEVCQDCHGGEHSINVVASTCIDCHQFHTPLEPPVIQTAEPRAGTLYLWDQPDAEQTEFNELPPRIIRRRPGEQNGDEDGGQ